MSKRSYVNDVYVNLIKPHLSEKEIEEYRLPCSYEIKSNSGHWILFVDKSTVTLLMHSYSPEEVGRRIQWYLHLDDDPAYNTSVCVCFLNDVERYGGLINTVQDVSIIETRYDECGSKYCEAREEIYSLGLPYILYIFHRNENVIMRRNIKNTNNDIYMNRYLGGE